MCNRIGEGNECCCNDSADSDKTIIIPAIVTKNRSKVDWPRASTYISYNSDQVWERLLLNLFRRAQSLEKGIISGC